MPILGGCICFDLPTGCKFIGTLYTIVAVINTLAMAVVTALVFLLSNASKTVEEGLQVVVSTIKSWKTKSNGTESAKIEDFSQDSNLVDYVQILVVVLLVTAFLSIVTSSMLISGTNKRRRFMLLPWVVQEVLHMIFGIAYVVAAFYALSDTGKIQWYFTTPVFVTMGLQIYFILVVISQFQALGMLSLQDEMMMK